MAKPIFMPPINIIAYRSEVIRDPTFRRRFNEKYQGNDDQSIVARTVWDVFPPNSKYERVITYDELTFLVCRDCDVTEDVVAKNLSNYYGERPEGRTSFDSWLWRGFGPLPVYPGWRASNSNRRRK